MIEILFVKYLLCVKFTLYLFFLPSIRIRETFSVCNITFHSKCHSKTGLENTVHSTSEQIDGKRKKSYNTITNYA